MSEYTIYCMCMNFRITALLRHDIKYREERKVANKEDKVILILFSVGIFLQIAVKVVNAIL